MSSNKASEVLTSEAKFEISDHRMNGQVNRFSSEIGTKEQKFFETNEGCYLDEELSIFSV